MSKLYFRYAAMNAGKSTHLLQAAYNYEERGMRVRLFTAALDDRSGVGLIGSRLGLTRQVETFGPEVHVLASHEGVPVLARQGNVMVASFHPELTGDARLHRRFLQHHDIN